jgi:predicted dehydrogenase
MGKVRAGVIGAGVFGGHHAGKYASDPRVAFVGVFDSDPERGQALAARHGARSFAALEALLAEVDVVTVASPALSHGPIALAALAAGRHVLVEKPIATALADADAMVEKAAARGLVLQVGHQERFVFQAMGLLDVEERPVRIEARRMGPFSERGADVSVTLDLMTHDLDLARRLADRADVSALEASGARERTDHLDRAEADLTFANGVEARLVASRLHDARERVMRVEYASGLVEIDFVAKTFTNTTPHRLDPRFAETPSARDSLGANVTAFIAAVLGEQAPAVSGADGREALALALRIDAAAGGGAPAVRGS